ncbi:hypothetical protein SEUCBS139899_010262 [Sporothrix eucalyptigena]
MPPARSRLGCDECRRRRRKCDEAKPACGPCTGARRECQYTLKIVRGTSTFSAAPSPLQQSHPSRRTVHRRNDSIRDVDDANFVDGVDSVAVGPVGPLVLVRLPNGVPLAPPYQRLLDYFARDVLASLSVHPAIHRDLAQGLVPAMLHEPHLLSAGLALAATGLASRGLSDVGGVGLPRVMQHLQTSGLALLRQALQNSERKGDSNLVATCLLWCLADVFAADVAADAELSSTTLASSSWRIHLQGIEALLGGAKALDAFVTRGRGVESTSLSSRSAMGHLHQLYRSLLTLPHVARRRQIHDGGTLDVQETILADTVEVDTVELGTAVDTTVARSVSTRVDLLPKASGWPRIDGFLGYSEELLDILQQVEEIASKLPPDDNDADNDTYDGVDDNEDDALAAPHLTGAARIAADDVLARAQAQALSVVRDESSTTESPRVVHIPAPALTPAAAREFALCHGCFQQATLIHVYRRLFRLPSRDRRIQQAVSQIRRMAGQMTQGAPCSTWVAMALPLFTAGCEAYTPTAQAWAHAALAAFAASIGSRHVQLLHRALEDIWRLRARRGDVDGRLCAGPLLGALHYNIILF